MSQPLPNPPRTSAAIDSAVEGEFSADERGILLQLAHRAIESAANEERFVPTPMGGHLAEPRGVFTTIYHHGRLRGCVGYIAAVEPLYRAVAETARAAAFDDTRFPPVTRSEARELAISLSVLSSPQPIDPAAIEVGRHGLVISMYGHRGLLLPQVAVEHRWDRRTFLEETCNKAGLPPNAWEHGARVEAFTAEVFSDRECLE